MRIVSESREHNAHCPMHNVRGARARVQQLVPTEAADKISLVPKLNFYIASLTRLFIVSTIKCKIPRVKTLAGH